MKEMQCISLVGGVKRGFTPFVPPSVSFAAKVSCRELMASKGRHFPRLREPSFFTSPLSEFITLPKFLSIAKRYAQIISYHFSAPQIRD